MVDKKNNENIDIGKIRSRGRKQTIQQFALGFIIFLCGAALGVGVTLLVVRDRLRPSGSYSPEQVGRMARSMSEKYDLEESQEKALSELMARQLKSMIEIRQKMHQQFMAHRQEFVDGMKQILTAEQFERFEKDFEELSRRRGFRRHPGRDPGKGPGDGDRFGPRRFNRPGGSEPDMKPGPDWRRSPEPGDRFRETPPPTEPNQTAAEAGTIDV